ncbi:RbsD or FucU transport [Caldicellulosiruptor owensensis OL]|uniref:D-ribose pyranase n=1 Tax=Caldicellulosiruptor owensensis (strain ATCC 700167 / DSM 13100 / OL) TaxID=632518 RepID=E4Q3F6_CALOW|nr:D-ribose pyranase [Caldicellulosiruptor owensensis]ADQ03916.1 RbsD or FucU transport [Caldicellulosiruptor owensensis OL]
MKKGVLLNSEISKVIAEMGHTDMLAIADSGLPIPVNVKRIDIALTRGIPSLVDTLKVVLSELYVEEVILAEEIISENTKLYNQLNKLLEPISIRLLSHKELKKQLMCCKAVIRTGEQTPYANIILKSGVVF